MTKFIALVSGKGGVGKTTSTINVGHALTGMGHNVVLVDGNLVTPNLALHLGLISPEGTINKFLRKEKSLKKVIYKHASGVSLIPASPSFSEFQKTNPQKLDKIFESLDNTADFVLIDSPSGLGYDVNQVLKRCDEAIVVVNPNLSSVMDGLKTIQLVLSNNVTISGILLNMSNRGRYELTKREVESVLGHPIIASVKQNKRFRKAMHKQMPLSFLFPRSSMSKEFKKMAQHISLEVA